MTRASAREEDVRKAEELRQAGVCNYAGSVRVNLLGDDPLAAAGPLPAMLLDGAPRVEGRCCARVWRPKRDQPVLAQCQSGCASGVAFCGAHRLPEKRPFGHGSPRTITDA